MIANTFSDLWARVMLANVLKVFQNHSVTRASGWLVQYGNVEKITSERSERLLLRM